FAMDAGDLFPLAHVGYVHSRANHVLQFAAERLDRRLNDGQRPRGLFTHALGVRAVGVDADAAGDGDDVARSNRAAIAHDRLPLRAAGGAAAAGAILDRDLDV